MIRARLRLDGIEDLVKQINNLGGRSGGRVLRKVIRAGSSVAIRIARKNIPRGPYSSGVLRRSLAVRIKVYGRRGIVVAIVGPRRKYRIVTSLGVRYASKYAHLVHSGRKAFNQKRAGGVVRRIGAVQGTQFLNKAMREGKNQIESAMRAKAETELAREIQLAKI